MADILLFGIGLTFILSSIVYFASSSKQRDILFKRLTLRGRRPSSASTPPRSLSPEKDGKSSSNTSAPSYKNEFPPSRREAAATVCPKISSIDPVNSRTDLLPFTSEYNDPAGKPLYTATGLSTADVAALGNFPDYASLTGVPLPAPYTAFNINKAKPRPYRPLRWAYHQTMSLTKLEPDWWLELEDTYRERIAQRQALYEQYGKMVLDHLPGSELACKELMEMALQFLCARYPQYFTLSADKCTFSNGILNTTTDLTSTHPLRVLLDHVPEDFGIVLRHPENGGYFFRAGVICSSLGWNVSTKIGMQLHEIHQPIPDYKEKMQFSMDRYFARLPLDKPIQRGSWGLEVDQPLFMPPGDPHEAHRSEQSADLPLSRCHFRVDWQTLRRLPLSGGVVFNFKALFTPVAAFRDEAYIPALCLKVLREGKRELMVYKNTWHVEHVVIPALEAYAREQEESGLVEKGWEVRTLDESPWFPGWEDKWHREQGY